MKFKDQINNKFPHPHQNPFENPDYIQSYTDDEYFQYNRGPFSLSNNTAEEANMKGEFEVNEEEQYDGNENIQIVDEDGNVVALSDYILNSENEEDLPRFGLLNGENAEEDGDDEEEEQYQEEQYEEEEIQNGQEEYEDDEENEGAGDADEDVYQMYDLEGEYIDDSEEDDQE